MKKKKFLSLFLALAMLFSLIVIPQTTSAYDPTDQANGISDQRANISFVYLGKSSYTSDSNLGTFPGYTVKTIPTDFAVGDVVWVGVRVSHMENIKSWIEQGTGANNAEGGMTEVLLSVTYDTTVVEPVGAARTIWNNAAGANLRAAYYVGPSDDPTGTSQYTWKYNKTVEPPSTDSEVIKLTNSSNATDVTQLIQLPATAADISDNGFDAARMFGTVPTDTDGDGDPVYIGVFPFKLNQIPAAGTKVIQGHMSGEAFTMGLGLGVDSSEEISGAKDGYAWISTQSSDTSRAYYSTTNLKNYFNLVNANETGISDGVVDLFPTSYKVRYDVNSTTYAGATYSSNDIVDIGSAYNTTGGNNYELVKEGEEPTLTVPKIGDPTTTQSADSLVTPPSGKVLDGWYTEAADGAGTKIDSTYLANNDFPITEDTTLYAHYVDGRKATFKLNSADAEFVDITDPTNTTTADQVIIKAGSVPFFADDKTVAEAIGYEPQRTGFDFVGWYEMDEDTNTFGDLYKSEADTDYTVGTDNSIQDVTDRSITLYAMWEPSTPLTFRLDFDGNVSDSSVTLGQPTSVTFDATHNTLADVIGGLPQEPTRTGNYKFMGWYNNPYGDGTQLTDTTNLVTYTDASSPDNETVKVYARWDYVDNPNPDPSDPDATPSPYTDTVTVHFVTDNDTDVPREYMDGTYDYGVAPNKIITDKYVPYNGTIDILPDADAMTRDGKVFDGWYNQQQTDGQAATGTRVISAAEAAAKSTTATQVNSTLQATAVTGGTGILNLYPRWLDNITVVYEVNTGTGGPDPNQLTKTANDTYTNPSPDPTKAGVGSNAAYKFIGWNTAQNGSGDYITTTNTSTYGDLSSYIDSNDGKVHLWAQWAAVPDDGKDDVIDDDPTDPDPTQKGVKVTFDENIPTGTNDPLLTAVNPKYKYPQYGDTIGNAQMPNVPTREHYVFDGWYTTKDGNISGIEFTGTTALTTDVLGDKLVKSSSDDTYSITVYAKWKVIDPNPKHTLTFNKNLNGKGAASDNITVEVYDGDVPPFTPDITAEKNEYWGFINWYKQNDTGSPNSDGKVLITESDAQRFDPTAAVNEDATYYALWKLALVAEIQGSVENSSGVLLNQHKYTGQIIKPKYKIHQVKYKRILEAAANPLDATKQITNSDYAEYNYGTDGKGIDISDGTTYVATYKKNGTAADLKDVYDPYTVEVAMNDSSDLAISGAYIAKVDPGQTEVVAAEWTVEINPEQQETSLGTNFALPTIKVYSTYDSPNSASNVQVASTEYTVQYKKIDSDHLTNNNIDPGADSAVFSGTYTTSSDVQTAGTGKYVIVVKPTDTNIEIGDVVSTDTSKTVKIYSATAAQSTDPDPSYTGAGKGENIYFKVKPNDPSAEGLVVHSISKDTPPVEANAPLKESNYTTDKPFQGGLPGDNPAADRDDYWVRVPKDTDKAKIIIDPTADDMTADQITAKVQTGTDAGGDPVYTTYNAVAGTGDDAGKFVIEVPITKSGQDITDITVQMTVGEDPDTVEQDYRIHVQQLQDVEIILNPGNSPYGLIERMRNAVTPWDDDKIQQAKEAFRDSDPRPADAQHPTAWDGGRLHYGADLVPEDGIYFADINNKNSFHYTAAAWEAYDKNYDMDETATFVYIGRTFTDPGITVKDQEGKTVTLNSSNLTKTLNVKQLITTAGITPLYNDDEVRDLALTEDATTGKYSLYQNWVRPDKYEIVYTYTYTDINDNTTKTLEVKRPLIVLSQRGDIELTLNVLINPNDISKFSQNFQQLKSRNGIFAWRMADIENTLNPLMNPNDLSTFNQVFQNNDFKNTQYYTYIN